MNIHAIVGRHMRIQLLGNAIDMPQLQRSTTHGMLPRPDSINRHQQRHTAERMRIIICSANDRSPSRKYHIQLFYIRHQYRSTLNCRASNHYCPLTWGRCDRLCIRILGIHVHIRVHCNVIREVSKAQLRATSAPQHGRPHPAPAGSTSLINNVRQPTMSDSLLNWWRPVVGAGARCQLAYWRVKEKTLEVWEPVYNIHFSIDPVSGLYSLTFVRIKKKPVYRHDGILWCVKFRPALAIGGGVQANTYIRLLAIHIAHLVNGWSDAASSTGRVPLQTISS